MAALVVAVAGWLRHRTKEQVFAVAALASLSAYALLYFAYFQFYTSFGLHPGDVGLTRVRLLEEALIGLLLVPVSHLQESWIGITQILVIAVVVRLLLMVGTEFHPGAWLAEVAATVLVGLVIISAWLGGHSYVQLVHEARNLGYDVRRSGQIIVDWVHFRPNLYYPYLEIRAIPVDVQGAPADLTMTTGCTLYLGQSDKEIAVFDVRRETVIRLPADKVNITLHPALKNYDDERLPVRCQDDSGNKAN